MFEAVWWSNPPWTKSSAFENVALEISFVVKLQQKFNSFKVVWREGSSLINFGRNAERFWYTCSTSKSTRPDQIRSSDRSKAVYSGHSFFSTRCCYCIYLMNLFVCLADDFPRSRRGHTEKAMLLKVFLHKRPSYWLVGSWRTTLGLSLVEWIEQSLNHFPVFLCFFH